MRRKAALVILAVAVAGGAAILTGRLLAQPDGASSAEPEAADGLRVQHVLAELAMRAAGVSPRIDPLRVSPAELNAFLARHVESRMAIRSPTVVPAEDGLVVMGRTTLGGLAGHSGLVGLVRRLPAGVRDLDLWVSARGRLVVQAGEAWLVVHRTGVGVQRVPARWLWAALGVDPAVELHWRLPRVVDRIEVQAGALLIHTRPRRS